MIVANILFFLGIGAVFVSTWRQPFRYTLLALIGVFLVLISTSMVAHA